MTNDSSSHDLGQGETFRRYVASLNQLDRMFSRPTDSSQPSAPDTEDATPEGIDEVEIERELAELENELDELINSPAETGRLDE